MLIDSHCHLPHLPAVLGTLAAVCARAREHGVAGMLSVATTPAELAPMQAATAGIPDVWHAAGLHPEAVDAARAGDLAALEAALLGIADAGVIALGETGLDYLFDVTPVAPAAPPVAAAESEETRVRVDPVALRRLQRDAFALHLEGARRRDLPVIVHTRGAVADTLDVIRAHPGVRGVIHCFTEDAEAARAFVGLGFLLSFSGILTFRNATALREVAAAMDASMLLVETDAPWLAPVPVRGKPNQPAWVAHTAACLAAARGVDAATIARLTSANFTRLFGVGPGS